MRPHEIKVECNGFQITALLDSGASCSLIESSFVKPENYTGEFGFAKGAFDPAIHEFPIAKVIIAEEGGINREIECLVSPHLTYAIILGNDCREQDMGLDGLVNAVTRSQTKQIEGVKQTKFLDVNPCESSQSLPEGIITTAPCNNEQRGESGETPISPSDQSMGEIDSNEGVLPSIEFSNLYEIDAKTMANYQKQDHSLQDVWAKFESEDKNYAGGSLVSENGLLFRVWQSKEKGKNHEHELKQLLVPLPMRVHLLALSHDSPTAGHLREKKVREKLLADYYWPGISADIKSYCASCFECQKVGYPGDKTQVPLKKVPLIGEAWNKVEIDLVGPFPESSRGNRMALTVMDIATRYAEAIPIKSGHATVVADALLECFMRLGFPQQLQHDLGRQFISELMSHLWQNTGVKIAHSSAYHPATNGIIERMHRTLKSSIKAMLERNPELEWDTAMPYVMFCLRDTRHESLGFSPAELMFGRSFRGPLTILKEHWTDQKPKGKSTVVQYVLDFLQHIRDASQIALENQDRAANYRNTWYDRHACERGFEPEEKVLLLVPNKANKLTCSWVGPYLIKEKVSDTNYVVEVDRGRKQLLHANMMKKFIPRPTHLICAVNECSEGEFIFPESGEGDNSETDWADIQQRVKDTQVVVHREEKA
jgi:hypothetical protein